MKYLCLLGFLLFLNSFTNQRFLEQEKIQLSPCPSSPNCINTQDPKKRKRMNPIPMQKSLKYSKEKLKLLLLEMYPKFNARLVEEKENYLHFECTTKIGKFIDDVEFLLDEETQQIHFKSASRKGWSDMGKNRRRMRQMRRKFKNTFVTIKSY